MKNIEKFTDTPQCTQRSACVICRRDKGFRDHFEKEFGQWECPIGLPIDAKDEQFPPEILAKHKEQEQRMKENQERLAEAKQAFEELSISLSGDNLLRLEKIRTVFFPQTKQAILCKRGGKQIGEVDQVCCGGTIKKVSTFDCSKHVICTDKKCSTCVDFERK
jgi:hypothetical protein